MSEITTSLESSDRTPDVERPVAESDQLSHVVIEAMAEALHVEAHEISPLYGSIDPDALDDLFGCRHNGAGRTGGRVAFDHGKCRVVAEPDRVLVFCE